MYLQERSYDEGLRFPPQSQEKDLQNHEDLLTTKIQIFINWSDHLI